MKQHEILLLQALAAAKTRRGFCAPNPAVGAVVVKNNQIIATGTHFAAGSDHAEIAAFKQVGADLVSALSLYVTLEPCCHHGKTPPCTDAIIKQGIKQVIYGHRDPNPLVAGKGILQLQAAGIECIYLPLPEITDFYKSYDYWQQHHRPWVTAKLAISLDGNTSGAITGAKLQRFTHEWRKKSDAILTTAKTIIDDDPKLNVRLDNETITKPIYILDSNLQLPLTATLFKTAKTITVFYHAGSVKPLEQKQVRCIKVGLNSNGLALEPILDFIGKDGVHDLWLEAGKTCFSAFHAAKLVQRSFVYVGAKWRGADTRSAPTWQLLGSDAVCELIW